MPQLSSGCRKARKFQSLGWLPSGLWVSSGPMKAYRAAILRFDPSLPPDACAVYESDGLLVVGPNAQGRQLVQAVGPYQALRAAYADVPVTHFPDRLIAPGFIDLHLHYPQTNVIGSPAAGLLPWLENYTFPEESRFAN